MTAKTEYVLQRRGPAPWAGPGVLDVWETVLRISDVARADGALAAAQTLDPEARFRLLQRTVWV